MLKNESRFLIKKGKCAHNVLFNHKFYMKKIIIISYIVFRKNCFIFHHNVINISSEDGDTIKNLLKVSKMFFTLNVYCQNSICNIENLFSFRYTYSSYETFIWIKCWKISGIDEYHLKKLDFLNIKYFELHLEILFIYLCSDFGKIAI